MTAIVDIKGKTFGRWKVIGLSHQVRSMLYWHCKCECGTKRAVFGADLKRGESTSCGCLAREKRVIRKTTHNMARHPAYRSYIYLRARCTNKKNEGYSLYGGRGIKVCDCWLGGFENFWEDMGPTWKKGLSIDRRDVNGNYEPSNCRWATPREQANNRRNTRFIQTPNGRMELKAAAKLFGLNSITVHRRIAYGWPEEDLLLPVNGHDYKIN